MVTFLFWNLAGGDIPDIVASIVLEHQVDVVLLAENGIQPASLLQRLNTGNPSRYHFIPPVVRSKVDIFAGFLPEFIKPRADEPRATIRSLHLPGCQKILLCALHLDSPVNYDEANLNRKARKLNSVIRFEEKRARHSRTIVVGDFNLNPFSHGLTSADAFNAVMTLKVAQRRCRTLDRDNHPFFFNPMWGHFNDGTAKPGGTFYYKPSGHESLYWHMLDQVLIRPDLISQFDASSLRVLDVYSGGRLTKNSGTPKVSDHLPIIFRMNL
jgi:hypothetical protein